MARDSQRSGTPDPSPRHLPHNPTLQARIDGLGRFPWPAGWDAFLARRGWQERRISRGLSELEVYRRLPSAGEFEYSGYLTATRVRFQPGERDHAFTSVGKSCIFHSHPTDCEEADYPSAADLFVFLTCRALRSITVGKNLIWTFEKTAASLRVMRNLLRWGEVHPAISLPFWLECAAVHWRERAVSSGPRGL